MQDVSKGEGRTVLFVSHNMAAVKNLCKTGIILKDGNLDYLNTAEKCIERYLTKEFNPLKAQEWDENKAPTQNMIKLLSARMIAPSEELYAGDGMTFEFIFKNDMDYNAQYDITFHLRDEMDNLVFEGSTAFFEKKITKTGSGYYRAYCQIPAKLLNEGNYRIGRLFFIKDGVTILFYMDNLLYFNLERVPSNDGFGYQGSKMGIVKPYLEWEYTFNENIIIK